jgi:mono/diheme cytochrome c family protein
MVQRLPHIDGKAPLEQRARAYLHANCSMCHTPDGPTPVDLDLRFNTPLAQTHLCGVPPSAGDLGAAQAQRLTPGDPNLSIVSLRLRAHGRDHMPPIGPQLVDDTGAALIDSWIRGLAACPQ